MSYTTVCGNAGSLTHWARPGIEPAWSQKQHQGLNLLSHKGNPTTIVLFRKKSCDTHMGTQKILNNQRNLEKENENQRYQTPWFQTVLQRSGNENSMGLVLKKNKNKTPVEQNWESRSKPPHIQTIYNKGGKNIQQRKNSIFHKWCGENWTATCKRMKVATLLHYPQISVQKGLKTWSPEIIKTLEENITSLTSVLSMFLWILLQRQGKQEGLQETKKLWHSTGH